MRWKQRWHACHGATPCPGASATALAPPVAAGHVCWPATACGRGGVFKVFVSTSEASWRAAGARRGPVNMHGHASPPCCPVLCHPRAAAPHQSMIRLASPSLLSVPRPRIPRRAASFTTMVRAANPALSGMRAPRTALRPNPRPMPQRRPAWWWQRCRSGGRCRPPTSAGRGGPIAGQNPSRWTSASCARRRSTALGAAGARPAPPPSPAAHPAPRAAIPRESRAASSRAWPAGRPARPAGCAARRPPARRPPACSLLSPLLPRLCAGGRPVH